MAKKEDNTKGLKETSAVSEEPVFEEKVLTAGAVSNTSIVQPSNVQGPTAVVAVLVMLVLAAGVGGWFLGRLMSANCTTDYYDEVCDVIDNESVNGDTSNGSENTSSTTPAKKEPKVVRVYSSDDYSEWPRDLDDKIIDVIRGLPRVYDGGSLYKDVFDKEILTVNALSNDAMVGYANYVAPVKYCDEKEYEGIARCSLFGNVYNDADAVRTIIKDVFNKDVTFYDGQQFRMTESISTYSAILDDFFTWSFGTAYKPPEVPFYMPDDFDLVSMTIYDDNSVVVAVKGYLKEQKFLSDEFRFCSLDSDDLYADSNCSDWVNNRDYMTRNRVNEEFSKMQPEFKWTFTKNTNGTYRFKSIQAVK